MKLLDVLTSPWAIQPEKLQEIQSIYETHLRGEKIDIKGVEQRLGRPLKNEPKNYDVIDGVAVIQVDGVIAKRMNLFSSISGGVSTELLSSDVKDALDNPNVQSIILQIDSPGGSVDGTQTLANVLHGARGQKPIVAFADGLMASAAYWIGAAADKIYISGDTAQVGSIGVVATHVDVSKAEEERGIKTTEIYAGKYKRIATSYKPLSEEGRQAMQDQVDYLYSVFVGEVAKFRGVSEEKVLKDMADGRIFIGKQAIDAGLVDGVSTLDALIAELSAGHTGTFYQPGAGAASTENINIQEEIMDKDKIAAEYPDIAAAFRAEGADAERARIKSVEEQAMPGHEALINNLKFDGKTNGAEAAVQVLAAHKAKLVNRLDAMQSEAPQAVEPSINNTVSQSESEANLPMEDRCKAKWDRDPSLRAEFGDNFKGYVAYERATSKGIARVLSK